MVTSGAAMGGVMMPGAPQSDPSYTYNLYEPEPDPGPEFSVTPLLEGVFPGFVVLTEHPTFGIDPSNWSDVVEFTFDGTKPLNQQSTALFYSDIEGQPFDPILVQRVLAGEAQGMTVYLPERYYPTVYHAIGASGCVNTYNIYSIPEPATLSLLALGGLAVAGRKRR
jgi:hypothetical protein